MDNVAGLVLIKLLPLGGEQAFGDFVATLVIVGGGRAIVDIAIREGGDEGVFVGRGVLDVQADLDEHLGRGGDENTVADLDSLYLRGDGGLSRFVVDRFVPQQGGDLVLDSR